MLTIPTRLKRIFVHLINNGMCATYFVQIKYGSGTFNSISIDRRPYEDDRQESNVALCLKSVMPTTE